MQYSQDIYLAQLSYANTNLSPNLHLDYEHQFLCDETCKLKKAINGKNQTNN